MNNLEYFNNPRINQSKLKNILYGFDEYKYCLENPKQRTPEMILGDAVHLLMFEPSLSDRIVQTKKFDRRGTEGKRLAEEQEEKFSKNPELIPLDPEDYKTAFDMAESIKKNEDCANLLTLCDHFEKPYFYEYRGILMKAKLDGVGDDFILDLKTTSSIFLDYKLKYTIRDYMYHFQAASYLIASGKDIFKTDYYILFVRSKPPYSVMPVKLSKELINEGLNLFDKACNLYNEGIRTDFKTQNRIMEI